jgi:hypothetical protein
MTRGRLIILAQVSWPSELPFGTIQFSVEEVEKILLEIDISKGPGPDGVPSNILKTCASAFSIPLSLIFNKSFVTFVFPDKWKLSFITPIFKDGKRNEVSNYRGISILSIIPKRFELLVYRVLYNDLKKIDLVQSARQYETFLRNSD